MEDEDRQKPVSITQIITEKKPVTHGRIPLPISVGNSGGWGDKAMGQERTYHDEDDAPDGAVIGARITRTRR